jgi:hypothetical protein
VLFLVHRFLSPWWRRRQVPPKRRFLQEPHDVTTQKTQFFSLLLFFKNKHGLHILIRNVGFYLSSPLPFTDPFLWTSAHRPSFLGSFLRDKCLNNSEAAVQSATAQTVPHIRVAITKQNKLRLYRLSDHHLSTKFSANFCEKSGVAWSARRIPYGR